MTEQCSTRTRSCLKIAKIAKIKNNFFGCNLSSNCARADRTLSNREPLPNLYRTCSILGYVFLIRNKFLRLGSPGDRKHLRKTIRLSSMNNLSDERPPDRHTLSRCTISSVRSSEISVKAVQPRSLLPAGFQWKVPVKGFQWERSMRTRAFERVQNTPWAIVWTSNFEFFSKIWLRGSVRSLCDLRTGIAIEVRERWELI